MPTYIITWITVVEADEEDDAISEARQLLALPTWEPDSIEVEDLQKLADALEVLERSRARENYDSTVGKTLRETVSGIFVENPGPCDCTEGELANGHQAGCGLRDDS
jgi:hypothetical protein